MQHSRDKAHSPIFNVVSKFFKAYVIIYLYVIVALIKSLHSHGLENQLYRSRCVLFTLRSCFMRHDWKRITEAWFTGHNGPSPHQHCLLLRDESWVAFELKTVELINIWSFLLLKFIFCLSSFAHFWHWRLLNGHLLPHPCTCGSLSYCCHVRSGDRSDNKSLILSYASALLLTCTVCAGLNQGSIYGSFIWCPSS